MSALPCYYRQLGGYVSNDAARRSAAGILRIRHEENAETRCTRSWCATAAVFRIRHEESAEARNAGSRRASAAVLRIRHRVRVRFAGLRVLFGIVLSDRGLVFLLRLRCRIVCRRAKIVGALPLLLRLDRDGGTVLHVCPLAPIEAFGRAGSLVLAATTTTVDRLVRSSLGIGYAGYTPALVITLCHA